MRFGRATTLATILLSFGALSACGTSSGEPTSNDVGATEDPVTTYVETALPGGITYWGSAAASALCGKEYPVRGFQPNTGSGYPLFLYFVGTGDSYDQPEVEAVLRSMARKGYVAVAVQYDNQLDFDAKQVLNKAACLFDPNRRESVTGKLCQYADCSRGVLTWGHSQGAAIAGVAANYDARVRATWVTGLGSPFGARPWEVALMLPYGKMRVVNGASDGNQQHNAANYPPTLDELTGKSCGSGFSCFDGADGSGWYIVQTKELAKNVDSHCWFYKNFCLIAQLEPNWLTGTLPFSLEPSTTWLDGARGNTPIGAKTLTFAFVGYDEYRPLPTPLDVVYPAGTIDWAASNFTVNPAAGGLPIHATLNVGSTTGAFSFWGPNGRQLAQLRVNNASGAATTLTVGVTTTTGAFVTRTQTVGTGPRDVIFSDLPANGKFVSIQTPAGAALKFLSFSVYGTAPQKNADPGPCPAPRLALQAANLNYVSVSNATTPLKATAPNPPGANETFTCAAAPGDPTKISLRAANGKYVTLVASQADAPLYANQTNPVAVAAALDVGSGTLVFKGVNGKFVSADESVFGPKPLVANRAAPDVWEQFKVKAMP